LHHPDQYLNYRKKEVKVLGELKKHGKVSDDTMEEYVEAETVRLLDGVVG
jgi:hypothetical protein